MLFPRVPEISGTNHPQVWKFQGPADEQRLDPELKLGRIFFGPGWSPKGKLGIFFSTEDGKKMCLFTATFSGFLHLKYTEMFFLMDQDVEMFNET